MVLYVTESGKILHEKEVYCYKGKYWTKEGLLSESEKDNKPLKNWGF